MMKLSALLRLTDSDIERRGRQQCSVQVLESLYKTDKDGKHKFLLCSVQATTVPRTTCMKLYDPEEKNYSNSRCWAHCSCQNFKYTYEVADTQQHSSSIILSDGSRPSIKNPSMIPALCKHLVALALIIGNVEFKDPELEALKKKEAQERQKQEQLRKRQEQEQKRKAIQEKAAQQRKAQQEQRQQQMQERQQKQAEQRQQQVQDRQQQNQQRTQDLLPRFTPNQPANAPGNPGQKE